MNYKGEELYDPEDLGDYLAHYGRKGMKWYQHIFGDYQTGAKYAKGKVSKKAEKEEAKQKANKIIKRAKDSSHKKMTNEEIQKRIDRLKLEKEYLDLSRETRTKGKRLVDKALDVVEKSTFDIAQQTLTSIGKKYLYQFFDKKIENYLKDRKK